MYGNEVIVGEAIAECIAAGVLSRCELFVTSKLHSNYHNPDKIIRALKHQLKALGLTYLDLYLIHCPWGHVAVSEDVEKEFGVENVYINSLPVHRDYSHVAMWKCMEQALRYVISYILITH